MGALMSFFGGYVMNPRTRGSIGCTLRGGPRIGGLEFESLARGQEKGIKYPGSTSVKSAAYIKSL